MAIALTLVLALFACGGNTDECKNHADTNGDGICEECGKEAEPQGSVVNNVTLIENGKALFQIVIDSNVDVGVRLAANNIKMELNKQGIKIDVVESDAPEKDTEILIGGVSTRGSEYYIDGHDYGMKGYTFKIVGSKVIIAAGSTETLVEAIEEFAEDVLGMGDGDIENAVMTEKQQVEEIQKDYDITSIAISGEDIKGYTIATDKKNSLLLKPATTLQEALYKTAGYWLPIVSLEEANEKSIIIKEAQKDNTPKDSFRIYTDGKTLYVESEYANSVEKKLELYVARNITSKEGDLNLSGKLHEEDVSVVYYSDFGVKGDGKTNDFAAMKAAHDFANISGQTVMGKKSATYLISDTRINSKVAQITIKTNVDWKGAKIVIDDTAIASNDGTGMHSKNIFVIASDYESDMLDREGVAKLAAMAEAGELGPETTKLDLGLGYPAMLIINNSGRKVYIRYAGEGNGNNDNGHDQSEIVLIDKDGNIDPKTHLLLDYDNVTSVEVIRADVTPITVQNANIEELISQVDAVFFKADGTKVKLGYIQRGFEISRSNATLDGLNFKILNEYTVEEQAAGKHISPYRGFFTVTRASNVTMQNAHINARRYYGIHGTYTISANTSCFVKYVKVIQDNYYKADGTLSVDNSALRDVENNNGSFDEYWGIGGSSYCKNIEWYDCMMTRFDAHAGLYNGYIKDSTVARIYLIGGGTMIVEDTEITCEGSLVLLREDYGSTWNGDVILKNVLVSKSKSKNLATVALLNASWYNHDYGYTCHIPNMEIDNLMLAPGFNPKLVFIEGGAVTIEEDQYMGESKYIHKEFLSTGAKNENPIVPPSYVKVTNNTEGLSFYIPENEFFKDTETKGFIREK